MSEMSQIHEFVNEIGDDVEVQWGASLDETLEDCVRVTIIATGFEVSNIPGLDDAVGKKSVDEAIKDFYGEDPSIPTPAKPSSEPVQEQEPELPTIVGAEEPKLIVQPPIVHEEGDIVIDFDIEEQPINPSNSQPGKPSVFAGWMRGRK
jgi:hypothetical protein